MQISEAKTKIFNLLCKTYDEEGSDMFLDIELIHSSFNLGAISRGKLEVALKQLIEEKKVFVEYKRSFGEGYYVQQSEYVEWLVAEESLFRDDTEELKWQPLKVTDFEELAKEIDDVSDTLSWENGYISEHGLEAEYTIEASKGLSESLRKNNGVTLRERLEYFITLLEKAHELFKKTTRVGKIVYSLIISITNIL